MSMFFTNAEHCDYLEQCIVQNPKHVMIASFGIYCGITYDGKDTSEWGKKYYSRTRGLVEKMRRLPDVKILVGLPQYKNCKGQLPCLDCEREYCKTLLRVVNHAAAFPEFQWRMTTELHTKCYMFFYDKEVRGVAGGRNFSDSDWADVSFELTIAQVKRLLEHTTGLWGDADQVTDAAVGEVLKTQKVSEAALASLIVGIV